MMASRADRRASMLRRISRLSASIDSPPVECHIGISDNHAVWLFGRCHAVRLTGSARLDRVSGHASSNLSLVLVGCVPPTVINVGTPAQNGGREFALVPDCRCVDNTGPTWLSTKMS